MTDSTAPDRIAVLAPMPSELAPLRKPLGLNESRHPRPGMLSGALGEIEIVATLTGIGMAAAAAAAERVIDATTPDHLIVVGIAGAIGDEIAIGDLIVPDVVVNLDTGASYHPTGLGACRPRGTLASSDTFLTSPDEARELHRRGVIAIDMETAAIAEVCARRDCPWSVFRAISDRADDASSDAAILDLVDANGNPNYPAALRYVLTRPHRIPQLLRLARGSNLATRTAAAAAVAAIEFHAARPTAAT